MRRLLLALAACALAPAAAAAPYGQDETLKGAVLSPLDDMNFRRGELPEVLTRALYDPYDVRGLDRCADVAAEIARLDAVLGRDLDEAPPPDERTRLQKAGSGAKSAAVSEVRSQARGLIPFRSWVRRLTGAESRDKKIASAIKAGGIRRGYLKGYGMQLNCAPPAAPSWFVPKPVKITAAKAAVARLGLWDRILAWFRSWWPW